MPPDDHPARGRREEVLRAAAAVFSGKGYRASTIQDIARVLGFTSAALYYYFASKQEILNEIITRPMRRLVAMADETDATALAATEKLRTIIARHIAMMLDDRELFTVARRERLELSRTDAEKLAELEETYNARIRAIIVAGAERGELRDVNPRIAASAMIGMINSALRWYRADLQLPIDFVAATMFEIFHRGVAAERGVPPPVD